VLKSKSLPLLAGAAALGVIAFATVPASADVIDPLHGQCVGTAPNCVDNGNNTPTSASINPFGFTVSPSPQTGDLIIDVLVPNNEDPSPATLSFTITGGTNTPATASLVTPTGDTVPTAWTMGDLSAFTSPSIPLPNSSPSNPIGAFNCSPPKNCANFFDPGLTGFYVYQANLGTETLTGTTTDPFSIATLPLPLATYITGFMVQGSGQPQTRSLPPPAAHCSPYQLL
jgi:hypothetical protein